MSNSAARDAAKSAQEASKKQHNDDLTPEKLRGMIRKKLGKTPATELELAEEFQVPAERIRAEIVGIQSKGVNFRHLAGGKLFISSLVDPGGALALKAAPRSDGWTVFGIITDNHKGNRHHRQDVENAAYETFEREGVKVVLNAGNALDGEARFNKNELVVHGIDGQIDFWTDTTPQVKGLKTYFITGRDHEGWWNERECINVGQYMQMKAEKAGRDDLRYIGHVEADVKLQCGSKSAVLKVMHPGGGSSYAMSYAPQKIVECVPLTSEILTPTGWKTHDQIFIGDAVLGYNLETKRCEWTALLGINRGRGEIVTYENDQFKVQCTRNHRWVMEWESRGPKRYVRKSDLLTTIDDCKERSRIIQAAQGPSGIGYEENGHTALLNRKDAVQIVLKMTSEQRKAFIYGMMIGEGTLSGSGETPVFSQNPGPVQDAFVLACFLEGRATGIARKITKKMSGEDKVCCRTTVLKKPLRMATRSLNETGVQDGEVWCPTTALGTWVMRQNDLITITGNSFQGGEKPDVLIIGHYHKFDYCVPREVHVISAGCAEDQTIFMRTKKIAAHVGFVLVKLKQDPQDGHVTRLCVEWNPFFDRAYYESRYEQ